MKGEAGFLSDAQVPSLFWAETGIFNKILKNAGCWGDVLEKLRERLQTPDGRTALSAGFFPERMPLDREVVGQLR